MWTGSAMPRFWQKCAGRSHFICEDDAGLGRALLSCGLVHFWRKRRYSPLRYAWMRDRRSHHSPRRALLRSIVEPTTCPPAANESRPSANWSRAPARYRGIVVSLALLALLPATLARAAEFERLEVTEDSGTYRIEASIVVNASREAVVEALLDFEGQKAIAPPIREIKVVGTAPEGGTLVQLVTEICIGPFCTSVKQVQLVRFLPPNLISGTVIPDVGGVMIGLTG